jgi:lipopolysaccharide export LptBFGC system permease protein LptF
MVALLLVAAAVCLIVGAKDAGQIAKGIFCAALILSAIQSCTCFLSQAGNSGPSSNGLFPFFLAVPVLAIGYSAAVAFWLYRRFGRRHRERRAKELERARDAERVRIYPPDDTEDSDVR